MSCNDPVNVNGIETTKKIIFFLFGKSSDFPKILEFKKNLDQIKKILENIYLYQIRLIYRKLLNFSIKK